MSDYLTRAVESIRPNPAAIRPRLPTLFEASVAEQTPEILPNESKREVAAVAAPKDETAPLRQRIEAVETAANVSSPVPQTTNMVDAESSPARVTPEQRQTNPAQPAPSIEKPSSAKVAAPLHETDEPKKSERVNQSPKPPPVTVLPRIAHPNFPAAKATEPPAIHITIGRIEVRAQTPAPPPTPKSAPRNAPAMSLDDYLRNRNGGSA